MSEQPAATEGVLQSFIPCSSFVPSADSHGINGYTYSGSNGVSFMGAEYTSLAVFAGHHTISKIHHVDVRLLLLVACWPRSHNRSVLTSMRILPGSGYAASFGCMLFAYCSFCHSKA